MLVPRRHWPVHPRDGKPEWPSGPFDRLVPYDGGMGMAERLAEREREEAERKRVTAAVHAMTRAVDLAGTHGVTSGVAFAFPDTGTVTKSGARARDQMAVVVMARMADGRALGGTAKGRDIPFDVALARVLAGHAATAKGRAGGIVDAVLLASVHLQANVTALAEDAVTRTCGEPCPPRNEDMPSREDVADGWGGTWPGRIGRGIGAVPPGYGRTDTGCARIRNVAMTVANNDLVRGKALAKAFLATLDRDAVELVTTPALTAGAITTLRAVSLPGTWEALDRTFGMGAPLGTALRAHPGLPWALVRHWVSSPSRFAASRLDGVGREAAMAAGVGAGDLRALGECLRDLAGTDVPDLPRTLGNGDVDGAVRLVRCLSPYPANWRPRGTAGWLALARCSPAVAWASAMNPGAPHLALGGGGDWETLAARLGAIAGKRGIRIAVDGIGDLAAALARQVVGPAMALSGVAPPDEDLNDDGEPLGGAPWQAAALSVLASGRTVARVLEASAKWHGLDASISAVAAGLPWPKGRPRGWKPAYPDLRMGGFSATVLTDDALLADEGRKGGNHDGTTGLGHCVGGYAARCRQGACRILSIRSVAADGTTARVSTVELVRTDKGARAAIRQHLGAGNHPPPRAAEAFVERYVNLVNSGTLDVALADLQPCEGAGDAHLLAGYDYGAPGNWQAVADAWAPLLPRAARGMAPGTLASAVATFAAANDAPWSPDAFGQGAWRAPRAGDAG